MSVRPMFAVLVVLVVMSAVVFPATAASALACDTWVSSADELHASITNLDCEGRVIRVKAGTYVPQVEQATGDPRSRIFVVTVNDLTLKGAGKVVLSGDIGVAGDSSDNSYHVIQIDTTTVTDVTLNNLTISHGNANVDPGDVTVVCSENYRNGGALFMCDAQEGSTLTLEGVTVSQNATVRFGGGIAVNAPFGTVLSAPPKVVVVNSRFEDNTADVGGGLAALFADVKVSNTTFETNQATFAGGGMEIQEGSADVQNSSFTDNTATATSGAFRILVWDPNVQQGSTIRNNVFKNNRLVGVDPRGTIFQRGGAVLVEGHANRDVTTVIDQNAFLGNSSVGPAGALEILNANAEITRNRFDDNTSEGLAGGALSIVTSPIRGGIEAPTVRVDRNTFTGNTAATYGGALAIYETLVPSGPLQSRFEVTNNTFRNNHAAESGGAAFFDAQEVLVKKNVFARNRAEGVSSITGEPTGNGGAIAATSFSRNAGIVQYIAPLLVQGDLTDLISTVVIEDSTFVENFALMDGGAISDDQAVTEPVFVPGLVDPTAEYAATGPGLARITVSGSVFTRNVAEQGVGGAIAMTAQGQHEDYVLTPLTPAVMPWVPADSSPIIPSTLDLSHNRIVGNDAGTDGGGVYIADTAELNALTGNTLNRNDPNNCTGCE